jgi:CubicO group peptidase (beta-lactamase class C family)
LLSHRSGLPYYAYVFEDSLYKTTRPKNADIIRWFEIVKPDPYGYPDRSFAYNNSNYMLLALIIEKVSGKTYAQYIRENICAPLDMNDTYVYEGEDKPIPGPITKGHEGRRVVPIDFFDEVVGDKGVYSTLNDLYRWHKALRSECLLKKETLRLAFTPTSFEHRGIRNYGLGFRMILEKDEKTPKYIYHNGWWKGYNSLFWFCPKTQSIIIILTNVRNKSIYRIKPLLSILEEEQQESESTEEEMGGE